MKTYYRATRCAWLAAAVFLALGAIALGSRPTYADSSGRVPFKGSYSGTFASTGAGTFHLTGAGTATHLGKGPYQANATVTSGSPGSPTITDTLTETLTAANGDTITLACSETATELSPGIYKGADQWTVVGGTGRFAGATGSGTAETRVGLNNGTFSKTITGTISVPHGN